MYFDIHSHILPGVDDGAKDICESVELINSMKKEGITAVIATPHFYPNEMYLSDFLQDRNLKMSQQTTKRYWKKVHS